MSSKSTVKVKRRQWSDDDMISAIESVRTGNLTITVAASRFNVPRKTSDDRLKGHVVYGVKPGVSTVLSAEEESSLVYYLLHMALSVGFLSQGPWSKHTPGHWQNVYRQWSSVSSRIWSWRSLVVLV